MKILLLGNGFDLYHKLPTKYENFLHTTEFLKNNYDSSCDTIGKVFGDARLQENDRFIKDSYERYKTEYDKIQLEPTKIDKLVDMAKRNMWFSYLLQSFNKDLGWIDFEREIATVIEKLGIFINSGMTIFQVNTPTYDLKYQYILNCFDYFHEANDIVEMAKGFFRKVKNEYIIEKPLGSKNLELNKDKIIKELQTQLNELAEMLKLYLKCFIDNAVQEFKEQSVIQKHLDFDDADYVFTLNYTHVYENVYDAEEIAHIHGNTKTNIVLGINADKTDELYELNTDFISFKKYYQRVLYRTDFEYKKQIDGLRQYSNGVNSVDVYIVGHSLDITDEDIIRDIFGVATKIYIYYHDEKAIGTYIKNLVAIYGQKEFERLRTNKELEFVSLYD